MMGFLALFRLTGSIGKRAGSQMALFIPPSQVKFQTHLLLSVNPAKCVKLSLKKKPVCVRSRLPSFAVKEPDPWYQLVHDNNHSLKIPQNISASNIIIIF